MEQKDVWDVLADKWKDYRNKPIPEVIDFLKDKKGNVLDLACGSGRNFCQIDGKLFGIDFSEKQVEYAKKRAEEFKIDCECLAAKCENLPIQDNFFDAAVFISSLHCIESEAARKKTLTELHRVLKPGAEVMISVWNRKDKQDIKEDYITWKIDGEVFKRYYYFYNKEEFKKLVEGIGFETIDFWDEDFDKSVSPDAIKYNPNKFPKRNIVIIARKKR